MKHQGYSPVWLAALFLLSGLSHAASDSGGDAAQFFTLTGFGTFGLARSDSDTAEYVRDLSQPNGLKRQWSARTDSVLGLQGNFRLSPQTEGVVQVMTRYRYDGSHRPEVSWAYLRHDFSPDLQMRAGRLGTEFYMLADSRLIGYSNVTVRPPPDFYGPLVFSYFDGIDASASAHVGPGILRGKLFAGHSPEHTPFYGSITWDLDGTRLIGAHLDYFVGAWQFRVGRTDVSFSSVELPLRTLAEPLFAPFPAPDITALVPELSTVGTTSRFDSIGVAYDQGPFQAQAMLGRIAHESEAYEDSRAGFVLLSYRLGEFTPYLGYSRTKSTPSRISTPLPPPLDAIARGLPRATHLDQHTVSLGTRWDFHPNWALKVQLDSLRGSPDSVFPFRGPAPQWSGRMKVLSTTVDFAF